MTREEYEELTGQQEYDTEVNTESRWPAWLNYAIVIAGIVLALATVAFVQTDLWPAVIMAFINCILYALFALYFLKKGTLGSLIPVVAPLWMILGSCAGIIYFAIFAPGESYTTESGFVSYFAGGFRYQLVIFCLLFTYFITMTFLLRNDKRQLQQPAAVSKYVGYLSMAIILPILFMSAISMVVNLPVSIGHWTNRLYAYYQTLLFAAGVVIVRISKLIKIFLIGFLGIYFLFVFIKRRTRNGTCADISTAYSRAIIQRDKNQGKDYFNPDYYVLLSFLYAGGNIFKDIAWRRCRKGTNPGIQNFGTERLERSSIGQTILRKSFRQAVFHGWKRSNCLHTVYVSIQRIFAYRISQGIRTIYGSRADIKENDFTSAGQNIHRS